MNKDILKMKEERGADIFLSMTTPLLFCLAWRQ